MATDQKAIFTIQDPKTFFKGLGLGLSIFTLTLGAFFTYAYTKTDQTLNTIETNIPFQVIELSFDNVPQATDNTNIEPTKTAQANETPSPDPVLHHQDTEQTKSEEIKPEELIEANDKHAPKEPHHEEKAVTAPKLSLAKLYEHTEFGVLPKEVHNDTDMTAYDAFKQDVDRALYTKPVIALAYINPEKSLDLTQSVIETLPASTTFFLSPYDKDIEATKQLLKHNNRELWLKLYVGNEDFSEADYGPLSLSSTASSDINIKRLKTTLGSTSEYAGITIPSNTSFLERQHSIKPLLRIITQYGLGISAPPSVKNTEYLYEYAKTSHTPFAYGDILIDKKPIKTDIINNLEKLKGIAFKRGYAVGYIDGYPSTIETVSQWLRKQNGKDFNIVPLSAIADQTSRKKLEHAVKSDTKQSHH